MAEATTELVDPFQESDIEDNPGLVLDSDNDVDIEDEDIVIE